MISFGTVSGLKDLGKLKRTEIKINKVVRNCKEVLRNIKSM